MSGTKNFYFLSVVFLLPFFFLTAPEAYAAEVYFAPHTEAIYPGDTFVLEAKISSPDEVINVADGAFLFDADVLEVKELSVGGSAFSLWAQEPTFSNTAGRVSFVGGVPDGLQTKEGRIVKAIFYAKREGETTLFFESNFSLLRNDGNGTNIYPQTRPLTLTIVKRPPQSLPTNEWQSLIGADTTPPTFVEAVVAKDPQFFDGRYFVSFFATDDASGVTHYEIKEGNRAFVRAVSPYVLLDQTPEGDIQIKSVDSAGNESVITPELVLIPRTPLYREAAFWMVIVLLLVAAAVFLRARRKNEK